MFSLLHIINPVWNVTEHCMKPSACGCLITIIIQGLVIVDGTMRRVQVLVLEMT